MPVERPAYCQTALDAVDVRELAEFYRRLLGLAYRPGDEPPAEGPDEAGWLVLVGEGGVRLAFQQVDELARTTWPSSEVPMQLHLDLTVPDRPSLDAALAATLELGGELIRDGREEPEEAICVFRDPAGHPFCVFVA
ncbi:hypothetical protein USB125703_00086 [Pseudoclavibacter triregionum]|nr:hypothetical protein USB125703_00086 [Pseudoclavibacter triregionum]